MSFAEVRHDELAAAEGGGACPHKSYYVLRNGFGIGAGHDETSFSIECFLACSPHRP